MMHLVLISTTMEKMITAFSWMLIHSLWQGLLLAVISGTMLMLNKRSGAAYRYNLALILFLAFAGTCAFTFVWEWNNAASQTIVPQLRGNFGANVSALFSGNVHDVKRLVNTFNGYFSANAPLIVLIWFIFFLFKSVKMVACLVYNQRIRTRQVNEPDGFWTNTVERLSEKLQIKKTVKLFESCYIKMPVVLGHLKPVILIPAGLLTGLPAEQVEAILLHELAHIRRSDYFINFLQNVAETIFFFNPGLLWVSSLLREERENCCDDIAVEQTQNKRGFIQAIISFKEHELYGPNYVTAFAGKKNYLLQRVSRILDNKNKTLGIGEKIFFTMSILILCVIITGAMVAQITEYAKSDFKPASYVNTDTVRPTSHATHETGVKKVKAVIKHTPIPAKQKMMADMLEIKGKKEPVVIMIRKTEPVPAVAPINNKQLLTDKQKAKLDQIEAINEEKKVILTQQKAMKDQEQALKNEALAKLEQKQAVKDEIRAKFELDQAMKEQANAKPGQEAMKGKADADASK